MKATKDLPDNYFPAWILDLRHEKRKLLVLNLVSIPLLLFFGILFSFLISSIRPAAELFSFSRLETFWLVTALLGTYFLTLILHELCHGIAFYFITGASPLYRVRWAYLFAAAPDYFIRRNPYLVAGLAPLVLISLVGIGLSSLSAPLALGLIWFALTTNAAGAVGDLYVAFQLILKHPAEALIQDEGDKFTVFQPDPKQE